MFFLLSIVKCLEIWTRFIEIIMLSGYVVFVVFVFYDTFHVISGADSYLSTLFLGKPPRQFTST